MTVAWELSLGDVPLELRLENFCLDLPARKRKLRNHGFESFDWELSLGISGLGVVAWKLLLGILRLGVSLEIICLGTPA